MRPAVLLILPMVLAACVGPPDPQTLAAGLLSVAEVTAGRLLDGDPAGAAQALAALVRN
jgi:hypothetical protein